MDNEKTRLYNQLIKLNDEEKYEAIMNAIAKSRSECTNILENFENEFNEQMPELDWYSIYVRLKTYLS